MGIVRTSRDFIVNDDIFFLDTIPDFENAFESIQKYNPSVLAKKKSRKKKRTSVVVKEIIKTEKIFFVVPAEIVGTKYIFDFSKLDKFSKIPL